MVIATNFSQEVCELPDKQCTLKEILQHYLVFRIPESTMNYRILRTNDHGPPWLRQSSEEWPDQTMLLTLETTNEIKAVVRAHVAQRDEIWDLANQYSSWSKLLRITVLVLRFVTNVRQHIAHRQTDTDATNTNPQLSDRQRARNFWAKILRQNAFSKEYRALKVKRFPPTKTLLVE